VKDQYFGDVNDYRKYGLLRGLAQEGHFHLGICWMLTVNDGRSDGGFTDYLSRPAQWRAFDAALFDSLVGALESSGARRVSLVQEMALLPGALFFSQLLSDLPGARGPYFAEMLNTFARVELIFLDPDNGLEVKSTPYGATSSSKYLYWREATEAFGRGHSLLIYQHFPRQTRAEFIRRTALAISERLSTSHVAAAATSNVCFFLALQPEHASRGHMALARISQRWSGQIKFLSALAA